MQYTADGMSYTFRVDGNDRPAQKGRTAAWKQIDMTTWETSTKLDGKLLATTTSKPSADGTSLTMEAKGPEPGGGSFDDTTVSQRASGGPGLPGKWKAKNFKSSAPPILEIAASGQDGLKLSVADFQATCDGKTLTDTGSAVGVSEKHTAVYDRQ